MHVHRTVNTEHGVNRRRVIYIPTPTANVYQIGALNTSTRRSYSARHDYNFFDFMHLLRGTAKTCELILHFFYIHLLLVLMRTALLIESQFQLILLASFSSVRASAFYASPWFSCLLLASQLCQEWRKCGIFSRLR